MIDASSALWVGLLLGVRHATDSDHVVTITAIVRVEAGLRSALRVALAWGLGHMATFWGVGAAIVLLGWQVPPTFERATELAVAGLLIGLGALHFLRGSRAKSPNPTVHLSRPFSAGLVHGMAGS